MTMEGPNIDDCMYGGIFIMEARNITRQDKPGTFKTNVQLCNMEYSHTPDIPLSFVSESSTTYLAIYTCVPYSNIEVTLIFSLSECQGQYFDYYEVLRNGKHITAEITYCSVYHILPLPHQFFTQNPDVKDTEQITNNIKNKVLKFILAKSNEQLAADLKGYLFAYSDRLQLYTYNGQKYPNRHNKVMVKEAKWRFINIVSQSIEIPILDELLNMAMIVKLHVTHCEMSCTILLGTPQSMNSSLCDVSTDRTVFWGDTLYVGLHAGSTQSVLTTLQVYGTDCNTTTFTVNLHEYELQGIIDTVTTWDIYIEGDHKEMIEVNVPYSIEIRNININKRCVIIASGQFDSLLTSDQYYKTKTNHYRTQTIENFATFYDGEPSRKIINSMTYSPPDTFVNKVFVSWEEASRQCDSQDAHLVTFNSADEMDFIVNSLHVLFTVKPLAVYIGAYINVSENIICDKIIHVKKTKIRF